MTSSLRILIVEDEWLIAQDYADYLTAAGHGIVGPVPTAEEALNLLSSQSVNLALLDVNLGDHKSYDVADELRERRIPFAFFTGYRPDELPKRFAGVRVLQKPVADADLLGAVSSLTRQLGAE